MVSFQITGNTPVDSWYSEVKKHDFTGEPRTTGTGHFTQVNYQKCPDINKVRGPASDLKLKVPILIANSL